MKSKGARTKRKEKARKEWKNIYSERHTPGRESTKTNRRYRV